MNDVLVTHLGTIDERLLFYLDEDDEMMFDTVERLRSYTTALLDASITPAVLVTKWSDWFDLVPAFVLAYGTEELQRTQEAAVFLRAARRDGTSPRPTGSTCRRWHCGSTCTPRSEVERSSADPMSPIPRNSDGWQTSPVDISTYLNHIRNDGDALLAAAKSEPSAPVPTCPEWSLSTLVAHTGRAHRWAEEIVRTKATEFVAFPKSPKEFGDRYNWYEEGLGILTDTLAAADPDAPVWNWLVLGVGPSGSWHRRMAHETAAHRWDAQNAVGKADAIETALALDGIDEYLTIVAARLANNPQPELVGKLGLKATDTDLSCTVALTPNHLIVSDDGVAEADTVVTATSSDLLLWLLGRRGLDDDRISATGNVTVAQAWESVTFT